MLIRTHAWDVRCAVHAQDISLEMVWFRFLVNVPIHHRSRSNHSVNMMNGYTISAWFFSFSDVFVVDVDKRNYLPMNWKSRLKSETVIAYNVIISIHATIAVQQMRIRLRTLTPHECRFDYLMMLPVLQFTCTDVHNVVCVSLCVCVCNRIAE